MRTGNNDFCYNSTGNALLEFFSKAGSIFKGKKSYYGGEKTALELFKPAWTTNEYKAMQLACWLRDIRGGSGNRSGFRDVINWLATNKPEWIEANMHFVPIVGRWDDLESLINTSCEKSALDFWVRAIQDGNQLAAKWAPREDKNKEVFHKLRKVAKMDPKSFRKLLVKNTNVVETLMCKQDWSDVDYNKVPSVAMARYANAFKTHDPARFDEWKGALEKGVDDEGNVVKVNAGALFPHDLVRTLKADSDSENLVNAQFAALPDYMEGTKMRIMTICDFSGSMDSANACGSVTLKDVSMALGLYCSDRLGDKNPFYRMFIPFSDDSKLVCWKDKTFSKASRDLDDGWCGSTNIRAALDQILESAQMFKATDKQIPNCLLIVSDMQFDQGTVDDMTSVEAGLDEWEKAGYSRPKIVYWNMAGYNGSPAMKSHKDVGLVSGFSPSILKAVLGGKDFTPMAIMNRALEKYKVINPDKEGKKKTLTEDWDEEATPKKRVEKSRKKTKRHGNSGKKKE